ncbi:zinc finger protein 423-like isoform X1 [Branchiostoma floridae]|uniref:Zinc finger protein 423-like isoform X1 n=1 Tax=Branchiostoma floridae TaxID=7739 RepID=A0A9J7L5V0_BRAFL|nr:zinc finger protein 423-like isoform X1 [Branchiostoma floridae]XP_035676856.1 zinc finger protein 423-like isoform X1 [Branchiostoma floridae]XP_035676857.1 zinc finger protein 423-like isoform X1 [Branchiostoma floridae]XP_035676858.1 zinc finger protein 423-like isoform X1 [Branchiostoma floridae]
MDTAVDIDGADGMDQGTTECQKAHRQASTSLNIPRLNMEVSDSQVLVQGQIDSAQTDALYSVEWLQKQMKERNHGETVVPNSRILRRLFSSAMAHRLRAQSPHKYRNALLLKDHLDILYTIFHGKAPQETANPFLLSLIEEYERMKLAEAKGSSNSCVSVTTATTATSMTASLSSTLSVQAPVDNFSSDKEDSCTVQTQQQDSKDSPSHAETQAENPRTVKNSGDVEGRADKQTEAIDGSTNFKTSAKKVTPKKGMIRMGNRCYSCFECYDVFKNSIELRMHFLLHHPSRLPYIDGEDDILEARQVIQATVERGEHIDFHSISLQFPSITEEEFLRTKNSCMSLKDKIQTTVQGLLPSTHSIKFVQNPMSVTTVDSAVSKSMLNGREELCDVNRETALDLSAKSKDDVNIGSVERKPCVPLHHYDMKSTHSLSKVESDKGPSQLIVKVKQEPNDLHEFGRDLHDKECSRAPPKLLQEKVKKETADKGVDPMPLSIYLRQANAANTDAEKKTELQKGPSGSLQILNTDVKMEIKRRFDDHNEGHPVKKTSSTRRKNTRPKRMRVDSDSWEDAGTGTGTEKAIEHMQPWADQAGTGFKKETLAASENSSSYFDNAFSEEVESLDKSVKGKTAALFKVKMCVDCNKTFRSHVDLKMHVLRNHPEKLPLLNWPAEDFPSTKPPDGFAEDSRPGLIYCTECDSTFKMFMDLKMHVMQVHPEKLPDFEWPNRDQMRKRGNPYRRSKRARQPGRKMKRGRSRSPKGRSQEREMTSSGSDRQEEEQFAQDGSLDLRIRKSVKKETSSEILDLSVRKVPTCITGVNSYSNPSADGSIPATGYKQFTEHVPGRKRGHRCSLCHETFALLVERKMHVLQCHPEKLSDFNMRDVPQSSTTTEHDLWTKEVPNGRGKNKYTRKCPMCTKEFRSLTMLKKHALAKHPGGLAEVCRDSTPVSYGSVLSFVPPSRVKSSNGASSGDFNEIVAANTRVHRARAMKRKCPACGACFKALSRLKQHVLLEHPSKLGEVCEPDEEPPFRLSSSTPKTVSCSECGAGFATPIELKSHFLKHHPSKFTDVLKPLASDLPVVKRFGDQFVVLKDSLLYRHMCEECGVGFATQEAKMTHVQVEHQTQGSSYSAALQVLVNTRATKFRGKMHLCPQCGTGFSTEIERKRHVLEHHPGQFAKFAEVVDPLNLQVTEPVSGEGDKTKFTQLSGYSKKSLWGIPCPANCETRCKTWLDLKKHVLMHHPSCFGEVCRYSQEDITRLVLEKTSTVKAEKGSGTEDINTEDGNIVKTLLTGHRLIQAALSQSSIHQGEVSNDKVVKQEHSAKNERVDHNTSSPNGVTQTNGKGDSMEKTNTRHVRRHWCPDCHMPFSNFLDLKFHVMMKHPAKLLTLNVPEKNVQQQPAGMEPVDSKESQNALPSTNSGETTPHSVLRKGGNKRPTEKTDLTHEELTLTEQVQAHGTTRRLLLPKPGKAWTKSQQMRLKQKSLSEEATKTKYSRKVRWQCPECKSLFDHFLGLKAHAVESHSFMLPLLDPETTKIRLDRKVSKDLVGETEIVQSTC